MHFQSAFGSLFPQSKDRRKSAELYSPTTKWTLREGKLRKKDVRTSRRLGVTKPALNWT